MIAWDNLHHHDSTGKPWENEVLLLSVLRGEVGLDFASKEEQNWVWRDGKQLKGSCCSFRGHGFGSQHLHGCLEPPVTSLGDPVPSSDF